MTRSMTWQRFGAVASALAILVSVATAAQTAWAISDGEELTRCAGPGSEAGQLTFPSDIAVDPVTSHVFVIEAGSNRRVSEFGPWCDFVKAFGWDVAPGAVNEQQEVRVRAATGEFKLGFGSETTIDLSVGTGAEEVETALESLAAIGVGDVAVEDVAAPDGQTPSVYVIAFRGSLAATDVAQLTAANGTTPLSGGVPSTSLEVRTRADGHTATVGLESCTAESQCKGGVSGSEAGQFTQSEAGVAVDATGNVYVREIENRRVQKFDSAGRFLLMFGGEVNKTTNADRCTVSSGDVCGVGVIGSGNGQFGEGFARGIALNPDGKLFVGDVERIQRFNAEGEWEASVPTSETVHHLAIDPSSGDFYAVVGSPTTTNENVRILDAITGAEKGQFEGSELKNNRNEAIPATKATAAPIATDATGNVFSRRNNLSLEDGDLASPLLQFDAAGAQTSEFGRSLLDSAVTGLAINPSGTLYAASASGFISTFGPGPVAFEAAPKIPPKIVTQFAGPVGRDAATLGAEINPNFWTDTRYFVQYGTGKCTEGGCGEQVPLPPGALLTTKAIKAPVRAALSLSGLESGTTYHYRFVAQSSGGGPVFGVDPDGEGPEEASLEAGGEAIFTTFPEPSPASQCSNHSLRIGPAQRLPNCRSYEMVSPVDKNNGDIRALLNDAAYPTALTQSATDGNRFTYSSYRAFADSKAAPHTNQYLAMRNPISGWSSDALSPPQGSGNILFENPYKAFTSDLCLGWAVVWAEPILVPQVPPGYIWPYRHDNCNGGYEALIDEVEPTVGKGPFFFLPTLEGISADGEKAAFAVKDSLTEGAASGVWQAYYASGSHPYLLCVSPKGVPTGSGCSVGTSSMVPFAAYMERRSSLTNALSNDGSKVYWTDSGAEAAGPGKVYLRENPDLPESVSKDGAGNCVPEVEAACTVEVSGTKTSQPSRFLGASTDGTKALFEVTKGVLKGDLYRFDAQGASATLIAGETRGVAGMSEDLSRVYFISEEAIAGDSVAGEPNLYLEDEGVKTFIATLSESDLNMEKLPSVSSPESIFHAAKATPDGRVLAFMSAARLTKYDNNDLVTGKADSEVYFYEVGAADPVCVSCNPSAARPGGRLMIRPSFAGVGLQTAAWLPLPDNSLDSPRSMSDDGLRLFFNTFDALLPRDTNGQGDVYEWERAQSRQACDERGAELYVAAANGCISLISTGENRQDSELLEVDATGDNTFFSTGAGLLPRDPGLIDIYDARVLGGIAEPPSPQPPCQGETCQPSVPAPSGSTPSSSSYVGPEDETQKKKTYKKKKKHKGQHKKRGNPKKRGQR
jgi:DNA-binding beta-propeller fold protein YncE